MKSLHIRNVDEKVLHSLKRLAVRHHRSLQGELHFILEKASQMDLQDPDDLELNLITVHTGLHTNWNREEIYGDDGR